MGDHLGLHLSPGDDPTGDLEPLQKGTWIRIGSVWSVCLNGPELTSGGSWQRLFENPWFLHFGSKKELIPGSGMLRTLTVFAFLLPTPGGLICYMFSPCLATHMGHAPDSPGRAYTQRHHALRRIWWTPSTGQIC